MLTLLITKLAILGGKHHIKKAAKYAKNTTEHTYHARMLIIYTDILGLTLKARKL